MVNNSQKYPYDQYTDGRQIMIGDRVAFRTGENADNTDLGYVVAVFPPDTKEACGWNVPSGGFLAMMDRGGLKTFSEADEEMRLIARGNDQDVARAHVFMQGFQHVDGGLTHRYDRYSTGEEIHLGDVVQDYDTQGIIEFFVEPQTSDALAYSAPQGGVMVLTFTGGRALFCTTEDDDGLKFIHRFDATVVTEFEKQGQLCKLTYSDGTSVSVDDEIEYIDSGGSSWRARVVTVCHPFTQLAWDEKVPTGGFRVRFADGDVALFTQMRPGIRLLKSGAEDKI